MKTLLELIERLIYIQNEYLSCKVTTFCVNQIMHFIDKTVLLQHQMHAQIHLFDLDHHFNPKYFFQVSWRKLGPNYLLTIGDMVYMSSHKIDIQHKRDWKGLNHWNLIIKRVAPDDAGLYECQVSSAQQLVYYVQLNVLGNGFCTEKKNDTLYINIHVYIVTVEGIVVN